MKVTVCFGEVKVVVPCGNGDIYIRDLVQKAAGRFLKATQRESQVNVRTLKTSNGGILDPDDVVAEVADDRELIIADYTIEVDDNCGAGDTGPPSDNTRISADFARKTTDFEISESHVNKSQEHQGSLEWSVSVEETEGDSVKPESVCGEVGISQSNESSASENSPINTMYHPPSTTTGVPADLLHKPDSTVTSDLSRPVMVRRPPSVHSEESNQQQDIHDIVIENTGGPLGIHVMPHKDNTTGESGLLIHGIKQDGRLANNRMIGLNDVIIEINGRSLLHASFNRAQEIFRDALLTEEICLKLRKSAVQGVFQALPAKVSTPEPQNATRVDQNYTTNANTSATTLSTERQPQQPHMYADSKELHVELNKGPNGLGISLSVRDNLQGQKGIYIRNILPKGAAMIEGRLKTGDRLMRINSIDITQEKTINEVMSILENVKRGSAVRLLVCREGDGTTQPLLPRPLPDNLRPGAPVDMENRHIKIFNIPLNDSGSAGLGISVKGKTATKGGVVSDLGIFIKAVITGGAASKDGRLWVNDQLLAVNNIALRDMSNKGAMEALRDAMLVDRPTPGHIKLTIARRNTPSIDDTDGAGAATVGGNVKGTVYKNDTDKTIPQPLDKNNNNGEKAATVELSRSTDGRGSSYRPVPAPRKRPSIVSSSISQSSYDSKPDDAELAKTCQSNPDALTCSTTETTQSEDKNIIVESVKTANFSPSLYLASFVHKDTVQNKDEVELNLTTNLGSRGRYEPIHPNHKNARPTVGQSKAVDNDSDSKAEDADSVKHFDTNDTENQSDPPSNAKVMEPLVWV